MMSYQYLLLLLLLPYLALSQSDLQAIKNDSKPELDDIHLSEKVAHYIKLAEQYAQQDPTKAYRYAREITRWLESKKPSTELARAYNVLGLIFYEQAVYNESIRKHLQALKIFASLKNQEGVAASNNLLGIVYFKIKKTSEAKKFYRRALKIYKAEKNQNGYAEVLGNIGFVYEKEANYGKALRYQEKALKIYQSIENEAGKAIIYDNIASIHEDLGDYQTAYKYFYKALAINEKIGNRVPLTRNYNDVGDTYRKRKIYDSALIYTRQALALAKSFDNYYEQSATYKDLAQTYAGMGEYDKAYSYAMRYHSGYADIFEAESAQQASQMQVLFEDERKDQEILQQKAMLKSKNQIQLILLSSLGLVVAFLFFLYRVNLLRKRTNQQLTAQKILLEQQQEAIQFKNVHITKSIQSALTIQKAILPSHSKICETFEDYFLIYKPKDIVSGDFYWISHYKDWRFAAVIDCTGHGVPGAFMSMIGSTLLDKIIKLKEVRDTKDILAMLNAEIQLALRQEETANNDGMDMIICAIRTIGNEQFEVQFSGAKLPIYYWEKSKNALSIQSIKGSRKSIGGIQNKQEFEKHTMILSKGDVLYLGTDGFVDQHNSNRKKLGTQRFTTTLNEHKQAPLNVQKEQLELLLTEHQQDCLQRDDITLMAVRI